MYTIGDFLIRVKNGYLAHKRSVVMPYSKVAESIGKILAEEQYIKSIEVTEQDGRKALQLDLLYHKGIPALSDIKIISKPSVQVYMSKTKVAKLGNDIGTNIVSTSSGMMTSRNAYKKGLGGEIIAHII